VSSAPAGVTLRPATEADIDPKARLLQAVDLHDEGVVEPVRPHLEDEWANPFFRPRDDTALAWAPDGALAAFATCWGSDPASSVEAWINVHPDRRGRGLGTWLLRWAETRARRYLGTPGASTLLRPVASSDDGCRFLERAGYRHVRTFFHLSRTLDGTERPGAPPEGVTIRPYREGDGPAMHRLLEAAFSDHFGFEAMAYHDWEVATLRAPSTELSLVFLAEHEGILVGALTAGFVEEESWVIELGVDAAHRGRGIGRGLLERVFAELAARGRTLVKLNVDGENPSGATRLYERAGMRRGRAWHVYEKRISAD
jgi:ribosomal protein S18 acetylase RimI-like enzyme